MAAVVTGNSLGLSLTSLATLGRDGSQGNSRTGRNGEQVYVNASNGNLIVQDQDDYLAARGLDLTAVRTYNSQAKMVGGKVDAWAVGAMRERIAPPSTWGAGTLTRTDADAAQALYTWDSANARYSTTAGAGAFDSVKLAAGLYVWTDGATGAIERYDATGRLVSASDADANTVSYGYDAANRLQTVTGANGETLTYTWSAAGDLTDIRTSVAAGPTTRRVQYEYDTSTPDRRLTKVTVDLTPADNSTADAQTYTTSYTYDGTSTRLRSITQSDTSSVTFAYDAQGRLTAITDALNRTTTISYDAATQTTITDPAGVATVLTYDAQGQLGQVSIGGAVDRSFTYNSTGDVQTATDGAGQVTVFGYVGGNLVSTTDSANNKTARTYNANNTIDTETVYRVAGTTPGEPATSKYLYNASRPTQLRFAVTAQGRVTEYQYDAVGQRSAVLTYDTSTYSGTLTEAALAAWTAAQPAGSVNRTDMSYDARGQLKASTTYTSVGSTSAHLGNATGKTTTSYIYYANGQLAKVIQPAALGSGTVETNFFYDGLGREYKRVDTLNQITLTSYDDTGLKTTVTLANGLVTTNSYDRAGNLLGVQNSAPSQADMGTTRYAYDAANRLVMRTDATGVRTFVLYDGQGRLAGEVDGDATLTEYVYDPDDRLSRTIKYTTPVALAMLVDGLGNALKPPVSAIRPTPAPATDKSSWKSYDASGRLAKEVNAEGAVTEYSYDGASLLVKTLQYATRLTAAQMTALGNSPSPASILLPTDLANDRVTRNFYDADKLLIGTLDGAGFLQQFIYDAAGQLAQTRRYAVQTNAGARATGTFATLLSGVTSGVTSGSGDEVITHLRDGKGQITATIAARGALTEFTYDLMGRQTGTTRYAKTVTAAYTSASSIDSVRPASTPGQDQITSRGYDDLGRSITEVDALGVITNHTYDLYGNRTQTVTSVGLASAKTSLARRYDELGRVTRELTAEGFAKITVGMTQTQIDAVWQANGVSYAYDLAGRRISRTDALGNKTLYFYDKESRLTYTVDAQGGVSQADYDALDNRLADIRYQAAISTTGLAGGLVTTTLTTAVAAIKVAGKDIRLDYKYLRDGQVQSVKDAKGNTTYFFYDAFGEPIYSVNGAGDVEYSKYDAAGRLVQSRRYAKSVTGVSAATTTDQLMAKLTPDSSDLVVYRSYDMAGRLTATVNGVGDAQRFWWDAAGNMVEHRTYVTRLAGWTPGTLVTPVADSSDLRVRTLYDALGRATYTINGEGAVVTQQYDASGNVIKRTEYTHTVDGSSFDGQNALIPEPSANDTITTYAYDSDNRLAWVVNGVGGVTRRIYDRDGHVTQLVQYATAVTPGSSVTSMPASPGRDRITNFVYDALGRQTFAIDSLGTVTGLVYDKNSNLTQQIRYNTLASAKPVLNAPVASFTPVSHANDRITRMAYDAANRLVLTVDARGAVTENVYDGAGNVASTLQYANLITNTNLTALSTTATVAQIKAKLALSSTADRTVTQTFDGANRRRSSTDSTSHTVESLYDGLGRVVITKGKSPTTTDRITTYSYHGSGKLASVTDAAGGVESYTWDGAGNKIGFKNKLGANWTYTYDAAGRLREERLPEARIATFAGGVYTAAPTVLSNAYAYDGQGRLISFNEGAGRVDARLTTYDYDALGRRIRTSLPPVGVYSFELDAALATNGQGATAVRSESTRVLTTETWYDALGNATGSKDVGDRISYRTYDQLGRVQYEVDAMRYVTGYKYNSFGEATGQTRYATAVTVIGTPTQLPTSFAPVVSSTRDRTTLTSYDKLGRVDIVEEHARYTFDPLAAPTAPASQYYTGSSMTRRYYNAFGEVTQISGTRNKAGSTYDEFRYFDKAGRLSASVDKGGFLTTWTYDGVGNLASRKEFAKAVTGATQAAQPAPVADTVNDRVTTYTWDALNRKTGETRMNVAWTNQDTGVLGTVGNVSTTYTYDAIGNAVSTTTAEGTTYTWYDALSRVVAIAQPARAGETGGTTIVPLTTIDRDAYGNAVVQTQYAKGASSVAGSSPTAIVDAANDRISYAVYDSHDHATYTLDANGTYRNASFDVWGHIAKEWVSLGSGASTSTIFRAYAYDALGRMTRLIEPASSSKVSGGSIVTVTQGAAGVVATDTSWNAFGEVTSRGTNGVVEEINDYDQAGRLWRTNAGDGVYKIYLYDQLGRRTAQLTSAGTQDLSGATYTAALAVADTNLRREDYRRDALGRVLVETQAQRSADYSDVAVRSTDVASSYTAGAATWDSTTSRWTWGVSTVSLQWSSLTNLGNGDVKVVVNYTPGTITGTDANGAPIYAEGAPTSAMNMYSSQDAAAGVTLTVEPPEGDGKTGSIAHVDSVTVFKKDINGLWVEVAARNLRQPPAYTGKVIEVQRQAEAVITDVQLWDTQAAVPQWYSIVPGTPGAVMPWNEFGDRYQIDLRAFDPARYNYKVSATPVGGTAKVIATGSLATATSAEGGTIALRPVTNRTYDRWGNLLSTTDPAGTNDASGWDWTTRYTYDANNRALTQTRPGSLITQYGYDKMGRRVLVKDANQNVNRWRYDTQGNLIEEIHADGGVVTNKYDVFNQRTVTVDAEGNTDSFAYDKAGHQTRVTHTQAQGASYSVYGVTRSGDTLTLDARTDRATLSESTTWDAAGRKTSQTNAAGETIQYGYDLRGNVTSTTLADGNKTLNTYDTHNRVAAEQDSGNKLATWTYDAFGRYAAGTGVGHTDIGGASYTYSYDKAGQLKTQTNTRGQNLAYSYDAAGQLLKIVDSAQVRTQPTAGNPSTLVANTKTTTYTYNLGGQKISEELVQNGIVLQDNHMGYDNLGRLRWVGDSRAAVNMWYDAAGNRTRVTTHVINTYGLDEYSNDADRYFTYDAMNRQLAVDAIDAAGTIGIDQGHTLTYDKNGNRTSDSYYGVKVVNPSGTLAYDKTNNLVTGYSSAYTSNAGLVKENYRYDGNNHLISVERDGMQVDRRLYDAAGRVVLSGGAENLSAAYLAAARPGTGERTLNQYNNRGQLQEQQTLATNAQGGDINHHRVVFDAYDSAGNLKVYRYIDDTAATPQTTTYTNSFVELEGYRLSQVTASGASSNATASGYDANGQLIWISDRAQSAMDRKYINDAAGMTVATVQGDHIKRQLIINSEVLGSYGSAMVDVQATGKNITPTFNNDIADFALGYRTISATYPGATPGTYTVRTGDTLRGLAQSAYGDARKWAQIAKANGVRGDADLRVGQTITIPTVVTSGNGEHDFAPYEAGTMVGDTRPATRVRNGVTAVQGLWSPSNPTGPLAFEQSYSTTTMDGGGSFDMGDFAGVDAAIEANMGEWGGGQDTDSLPQGDYGSDLPNVAENTYNPTGQDTFSVTTGHTVIYYNGDNFAQGQPPPTELAVRDIIDDPTNSSYTNQGDRASDGFSSAAGTSLPDTMTPIDANAQTLAFVNAVNAYSQAGSDVTYPADVVAGGDRDENIARMLRLANDPGSVDSLRQADGTYRVEIVLEPGGENRDDDASINFARGFQSSGTDWSVLEGDKPFSYSLGGTVRSGLGLVYDGLTGAGDLRAAGQAYGEGDYFTSAMYGMRGVGTIGLTAVSLGEFAFAKAGVAGIMGSTGFKLGGEAAEGLAFSPIVPGGGLAAHEAAGGHLLLKHVGQTEAQLFNRLASEPGIDAASSFYSRSIAESAASAALQAQQAEIAAWLLSNRPQIRLSYSLSESVGIAALRGESAAVDLSSLRLILRRDVNLQTGYRIHTGFPTP
ncbi:RNase A-like domain-containing protein [Caenimonas sp. SL110]|uniref:RNase A-like domain-containing protein n=1 Tax=Caenimonas sp. SL110 TaxID=1450524 RepID=UPI00065336B8|nr:RNase A-like domain-containing protein [Caenimonas sp. SL110]